MKRSGFHKIQFIEEGPVTTLFLAYGKRKPWHYLVDGSHVLSDKYRDLRRSGLV